MRCYFTLTQTDLLGCLCINLCLTKGRQSYSIISTIHSLIFVYMYCLPKPGPYCQLLSLDSITTAHFAVSSISAVAITMPTLPDGQSPVGFFFFLKLSIKLRLLFFLSVKQLVVVHIPYHPVLHCCNNWAK